MPTPLTSLQAPPAGRYAHGLTAMRGMAARHLAFHITARATKA
jgi:hypothetical protein